MRSVGVIYGVLGLLVLCEINAQYSGYGSYYNQSKYYKQYPQYNQAQANAYRGYSRPQRTNSNAYSRHDSKGSLLTGVRNQFPTYTDKKTAFVNTQNVYGNRSPLTPNTQYQSQVSNFNQPNYYQQQYQQQHFANARQEFEQKLKQHQKQMQQLHVQKLPENYARYPTVGLPSTTTGLIHKRFSKVVKPVNDDGRSPAALLLANQKGVPSGGKSLADLVKETAGQREGGKSSVDLLGKLRRTATSATNAPKKPLTYEIPHKPTVAPEGGKSLFDRLAEIPKPETADDNSKSRDAASGIDESAIHGKKNSDIAGGDYGLDVRAYQ